MNDEVDFTLAFQDTCDQIPLLLIHGFPLSGAMWELQLEDLDDVARVIAPDLRGHGRSDATPPPYSMQQLAEDCTGLLDFLGITRPAVVCGLSMGGYIAFELYRRFPDYVAGLILTATRATADSAEGKANRDRMAETIRQQGIQPLVDAMLPKLFAPQTYENDPELVEFVREMMSHTSVDGAIGALAAMRDRSDSTPTLAQIDVPTLIIHGRHDQIVPLAEAEAMRDAIPNARLVVLENAGHLPNLEQPDEFNDAVIDFLESIAAEEEED
ncbi:MAG: alpha/beta fold hydrolase [Chloroflexi bacterium]|nr:MAG: alpha/beta fold hydrolase [Chloroflexota bacterium]